MTVSPSPVTASRGPLVSFVVVGKNDDYMGNYQWRVTTALNLLVQSLVLLGRQEEAEIVFCDWNSDVPFHTTMPLFPEARDLVRFVVVPPALARPLQRDAKFANCLAHNTAIRRARGAYISVTDADIVLMPGAVEALFRVLEQRIPLGVPVDQCFMACHRRQLPVRRTCHNPPPGEVFEFLRRNGSLLQRDALFPGFGVPAGIAMMHRDLWEAARGYDERLIHGGWIDVDLQLRMSQKHRWVDLTNFGVELVHIEHYTGARQSAPPPRKFNGYPVSRRFAANDENWGQKGVELAVHAPEVVLDGAALAAMTAKAAASRAAPTAIRAVAAEMQDAAVTQCVQRVLQALPHAPEEHDLLLTLAWYAHTRHPRSYVELGVQRSAAPTVVLAACPTCETYLIDQWSETDDGGDPPVYQTSNAVAAGAPQAQTHFITADPADAIERLLKSVDPGLAVDLAVVRTDVRLGNPTQNTLALAERLAPGGALVVCSRDGIGFADAWNALLQRLPGRITVQFQQMPGRARTGFVLAVAPAA